MMSERRTKTEHRIILQAIVESLYIYIYKMRSFGERKNFWSVVKHTIFLARLLKVDRPEFL